MLTIPSELARSALDAAPDAMIIIDAHGLICFANRQASALFGYSHEDLIGKEVEQLMPERFRSRHLGHRDGYVRNLRVRPMGQGLELYGRRRDGSEFPVEISLSPIVDGERVLTAAAIRDVTDRKRVEAELIVARESAERARAAADRQRQIADEARESADRANQGKSRFLATASHDLRQPLQTLALLNGALRRIATDPDSAEALEQQDQAIGAMSRLLNALLDISKLESGAIKPEPTDFTVASVFEELRQEFASLAANKGLRFEIDSCQDCVHSDPALVEQILRNLVSNAVKYTREGWVRLRCIHEEAVVRLEVIDTGIGIPPDQIPFIYDEFYQVGVPTNSTREGYGLGLSIVQRLVKLLQLRLEVRSQVGKGSAFSLTLPASSVQAAGALYGIHKTPTMPAARKLAKARVLLVEDDLAVRDATRLLLKVEGYDVAPVASLTEALQKAQELDRLDLLVTDYHLREGETGIQVITTLRKAIRASLAAVLITGDTSTAIKELPVDPNLRVASKPIRAEELLSLIRELLGS